jgi:hypothetical protein
MTRDDIIAAVAEYNRLLEAYEALLQSNPVMGVGSADRAALVEFLQKYPAIDNYDDLGNYIGAVAYENGYTP